MTMKQDLSKIHTQLALIGQDLIYIKKSLNGNGEPGLLCDTRKNTNFRIGYEAKSKLIGWAVGSGWLLAVVVLILSVKGLI